METASGVSLEKFCSEAGAVPRNTAPARLALLYGLANIRDNFGAQSYLEINPGCV